MPTISILQTAFVTTTGAISEGIVTDRWVPVIRGAAPKENALQWELICQVSAAKRKTFMSKVYMVGNALGWDSPISTLKGTLSGVMEALLNSNTGQVASPTTMAMRIVFILLASLKTIITNGMT